MLFTIRCHWPATTLRNQSGAFSEGCSKVWYKRFEAAVIDLAVICGTVVCAGMNKSHMIPRSGTGALFLAWFLFVVAATLYPFNFGAVPNGHLELFAYSLSQFGDVPDVFCNLLLFLPLGALVHREGQRRSWGPLFTLAMAGACGLLISLTVEYLQAFLPTRDSSLIDVLANSMGALLGVFAHRAWNTAVVPRVARLRARMGPTTLALMMVGYLVPALLVSGVLQARTRLSNWSLDYPLFVGNEGTGDRPWQGRVLSFELTDAATPLESLREFARGRPLAVPGHQVATFDFTGSAPYKDASGRVPELDWTQHLSPPVAPGIRLTGRPWLRTKGAAPEIARRIRASNAFTLRVLCAAGDTSQGGPARIISNSLDHFHRNFTLGQEGGDMIFRVRTPATGLNANRPQFVIPGVFSTKRMRDILVTYDGATLFAAVASGGGVYRRQLNPGSSLLAGLQNRADDLPIYELGYEALLFVLPGMLLGALADSRYQWLATAVPWLLLFAALLEGTMVLASGRPFEWENVAAASGVGAFILAIVSGAVSSDISDGR
jgi:VanZ family protein